MDLTITPRAAQKIHSIMAEKGGNLALQIEVRRGLNGPAWRMALHRLTDEAIEIGGVSVIADKASRAELESMVIDWVQTPKGPGFGVFNRSLSRDDRLQAAD